MQETKNIEDIEDTEKLFQGKGSCWFFNFHDCKESFPWKIFPENTICYYFNCWSQNKVTKNSSHFYKQHMNSIKNDRCHLWLRVKKPFYFLLCNKNLTLCLWKQTSPTQLDPVQDLLKIAIKFFTIEQWVKWVKW